MNDTVPVAPDDDITVLAGRYELRELLGSGGMADVYAAVDRRLGRTVAVKILRADLAHDESVRGRFAREAHSAAALNHPAVVAVHDTGDETAEPFIVMEYVAGHTLRDVMYEGQPMAVDQALEITTGVLHALEYAHAAGIVHRDIKPGNIMITPTGAVKVMDFGIARAVTDDMTITQTVVGTPAYLSPEHAEGRPVDIRSDLYSTGCVLFELLTGRPPFISESAYVVAVQHIQEPPPVPSTLNPALPAVLDQIVAKALVKDREARFQTAAEFRAALAAVATGGPVPAVAPRPETPAEHTTDPIVVVDTARMPVPALPPLDASVAAPVDPVAAMASAPPPAPVPASPFPAPVPADPPATAFPVEPPVPNTFAATAPTAVTPPTSVMPAGPALGPPAAAAPVEPPTYPAAAPRATRRWPWVAAAVAAGVIIVGGVLFAVLQDRSGGGGAATPGATPVWTAAFDTSGLNPRPDPKTSVFTASTGGTVSPINADGSVWPLIAEEDRNGSKVVTLSADILFPFGASTLDDGGEAMVRGAVKYVPKGSTVHVTGYTDSVGTDAENFTLSQKRAAAVAAVVVSARPDLDVHTEGRGPQDPVAPNTEPDGSDNPEGRALNRRVELTYS